jgi:succinoglycan biosynthesis protein ExoU
MDSPPREVAILIAAYNAGATLDRAIESALAQPETAEVCVADDGSTDDTLTKARKWAENDGRVIVLAQPRNAGPAAARNAAIAATSAPWLGVLDADDYMLPGRLKALLVYKTDADFVADALIRVQEGETPTAVIAAQAPHRIDLEAFLLGDLGLSKSELNFGFLKPLMRRSFLQERHLRYNEHMRLGEDFDLYARALAHDGRFWLGGPAGYISVERSGSLSTAHGSAELRLHRDNHSDISAIRALSPAEDRALRRHWDFVDRRLQWSRFAEAAKAGDLKTALSAFHTPQAGLFVARCLIQQIWRRGTAFARQQRDA